jgi:hypothetical protein
MLADRSNAGIALVNADNLQFLGTYSANAPGAPAAKFTGVRCDAVGLVVPCTTTIAVNNNISGPDGVTSHGVWIYAGDGDSTVKVIDFRNAPPNGIVQTISTGGTTRVDEMALNLDGTLLLAANNAEDPPFATLFQANGNSLGTSNVSKITQVKVDPSIIPSGFGLSLEQPTWEPTTQRFWTSIPVIAENPAGCNAGQNPSTPITCDGGVLVFDPNNLTASQCGPGSSLPGLCVLGHFNTTTYTGVIGLRSATLDPNATKFGIGCGPNGITVGPNANLLLGCTPGNNWINVSTQIINAPAQPRGQVIMGGCGITACAENFADVSNITGSDEVWFNPSIYAPSRFIR